MRLGLGLALSLPVAAIAAAPPSGGAPVILTALTQNVDENTPISLLIETDVPSTITLRTGGAAALFDIGADTIGAEGVDYEAMPPEASGHSLIVPLRATRDDNPAVYTDFEITFVVANVTEDTTPAAFIFTDQTGVALSTLTESNAITVSGIDGPSAISITGGEYQKNGGSWTSASGTVVNGDTVKVRHTSSASNSTATNTVLTIGGISDTFTTTTEAEEGAHLYDFTAGSLPSGVTASGGTNGTVFSAANVLTPQAAPRFDYLNGVSRGILVEPSAQQIFTSTDPAAGIQTLFNLTPTSVAGASITGGAARRLAETTTNGFHLTRCTSGNATAAGQRFCFTAILTAETLQWVTMQLSGSPAMGTGFKRWVDVQNVALGATFGAVVDSGVIALGGSFVLAWIAADSVAAGTINADLLFDTGDNAAVAYAGSTSKTILLSYLGLEKSPAVTSPIITNGSSLTRSADSYACAVPAGVSTFRLVYDDETTSDVAVTPGGTFTLNSSSAAKKHVKYIDPV